MGDLLAVLLPVLLGGGFLSALTAWYIARKKTPAEADSIIVGGAEQAVLTLQTVLKSSEAQREAAVAEVVRLDRRCRELTAELDDCRAGRHTCLTCNPAD